MPARKFARATISNLKKDPMEMLRFARGRPLEITSHGKTVASLLSARAYERLMDTMEDLRDVITVYERIVEPGIPTTIEELMKKHENDPEEGN
jgi:prevent-host-death family protein